MAASPGVPAIGTKLGPCPAAHRCEHLDCKANRETAEAVCPLCEAPIGYETPFYFSGIEETKGKVVHRLCLDLKYE